MPDPCPADVCIGMTVIGFWRFAIGYSTLSPRAARASGES
jgi:hypothetical protein